MSVRTLKLDIEFMKDSLKMAIEFEHGFLVRFWVWVGNRGYPDRRRK